jgi:SAM-dependent methyltransferase
MLDVAHLRPGDRVLELACGAGGLGLTAAEHVAPGGEVVITDVVAEMTSIARQRATDRGLRNVTTRVLDLEEIDEADESYDAVLCREGLMFATDHLRAVREIRRVLRPEGRVALAVWGPRERNPWLGVVLDSVSAQLDRPVPPPGIPGPFALDDSGRLAQLLSGGGLSDVTVDEASAPLRAGSFDEWWTRTCALAGPLAKMLESLPEETIEAIRERARREVAPYATADGLDIPGVTLLAGARR